MPQAKSRMAPLEYRLWRRIERRGPDECWPWMGTTATQGYGTLGRGDGTRRLIRAHRAVWEQFNGPIPEHDSAHGFVVMHTCDNRACCNPAHLRLGTQFDNVRDMDTKMRRRNPELRGETNPNVRLTAELVRLFRASSKTATALAHEYGCHQTTVSKIRRGETWRHLL